MQLGNCRQSKDGQQRWPKGRESGKVGSAEIMNDDAGLAGPVYVRQCYVRQYYGGQYVVELVNAPVTNRLGRRSQV